MKNNKGLLVVCSGPSGVGKGTVIKKLLEKDSKIKLSISATTRAKRGTEENGREYYFLSKEEFFERVNSDGMLEYAQYCDNYYGTPKKEVENWLNEGKNVLLEIEVDGALQVIKKNEDALSVFIMPPSLDELRNRLVNRGTDAKEVIEKRLEKARLEIKTALEYDYIVINENIDECAENIKNIIYSDGFKTERMSNFVKGVLKDEKDNNK